MSSTRCIDALNTAAGRELTADEVQGVFDRINRTARDLAAGRVEAPGGPHNLNSQEGIIRQAAEVQAQGIVAEGERKVRNAHLQVATIARRKNEVGTMLGNNVGQLDAVRRLIANDADGRANQFSLESRAAGIEKLLRRQVQDTWEGLGWDWWGLFQNKSKTRDLIREIKGEDSGNAIAKKGAEAWAKVAEEGRQLFNDRGGDIGHLDDWGMPRHHSQERVARAGGEQWMNDVMPMLNRDRYTDIRGEQMTEPQIRAFLGEAYKSIATNGANKIEPGQFKGSGARANRHAEERQIHLKDAESEMAYWDKYGEKTFPDIMLGHIDTMAKDIAFLEHFGPNPDATYRMLRDEAYKAQAEANPAKLDKTNGELSKVDNLYDYASGKVLPVANRAVARGFNIISALNTAGKLGSAFWASLFGDKVTFEAMAHVNNLPVFQRWYNELRLLNPANASERRMLRRQALMLDYMSNSMNRFGEELGRSPWTGKVANTVMRISGMSAINEWRRGAWALSAMDAIGHEVQSKQWSDIGPQDAHLFSTHGITEHDWGVWKLAEPADLGHGNDTALTPEAINRIPDDALRVAHLIGQTDGPEAAALVRHNATVKLLGALTSESHLAVIEPGWQQRATMYGGLQRGKVRDEFTRAFWQFKSFPWAQFQLMLDVGMSRPTTGGKIGFMAAIPIMSTIAGAMMLQTQDLLAGKDPRPMNDWKFLVAAFMKGGTLGLYGDFLYSQSGTTRYGTGPLEAVAGPTIGAMGDIADFAAKSLGAAGTDKETHFWAKALGIVKGFVPGQNLWYTKAATDHIIFQTLQEMLSPGYLSRMKERTQREFGQQWWWEPGESAPQRAPNLEKALESNR